MLAGDQYLSESHSGDCIGLQSQRLQTTVGSSPTSPAIAYLPKVEKVEAARALAVEGWASARKENQCSLKYIGYCRGQSTNCERARV